MNSGSVQKAIHSSWIAPAISLAVLTMIHLIFSPSLDQQKTWFALKDELCVVPPRKFCSNGSFYMFPAEVCRVDIGDLEDKNGGLVPLSWFNLTREPKLLTPSMLVLLSLYSLEICPGKILPKENFSNQRSSNI